MSSSTARLTFYMRSRLRHPRSPALSFERSWYSPGWFAFDMRVHAIHHAQQEPFLPLGVVFELWGVLNRLECLKCTVHAICNQSRAGPTSRIRSSFCRPNEAAHCEVESDSILMEVREHLRMLLARHLSANVVPGRYIVKVRFTVSW